jgi:hypothetical protein
MHSGNTPLLTHVKELEDAVRMLEDTNFQLKQLVESADLSDEEASNIRTIVVENEYAIEAKIRKRRELLRSLGLDALAGEFETRQPGPRPPPGADNQKESSAVVFKANGEEAVEVQRLDGIML